MALVAALLVGHASAPGARAENAMGYRLLSDQEARTLPRNDGALGIDLERSQRMTDNGMTFDIMQVTGVKPESPGAQAGFRRGDQIIAVNGRLFPSLQAFAAYVGSMEPGSVATIDYMPAGSGPEHAERVAVTVGGRGRPAPQTEERQQSSGGLSTGTKIAIGAGAVALLGCYEFGCFSHRTTQPQRR
jgi:membrane-associated protease RseP (regulator of RpoE activity)